MKSLILKSLTITTLVGSSLVANSNLDKRILSFEKNQVEHIIRRNRSIKLIDMDIVLKKDLNYKNWQGYVFNLNLEVKGKKVKQKDYIFSDGKMITSELININTRMPYKYNMYPTLSKKYFEKEHLIAGNPNAEHSLVIFSDPLCPICVDEIPPIMKKIMDNPKNIALYYYDMPLNMHPTSPTLVKATMIASNMGIKDIEYKLYTANSKYFYGSNKDKLYDPYREKDNKKALKYFNDVFKTNITMAQIDDKKLDEKVKKSIDMAKDVFVNGTPTMFFDGEIDIRRDKYLRYLK